MLIYTHQKSKPKKVTKKQQQEYDAWLQSVNNQKTSFSTKPKKVTTVKYQAPKVPDNRSTRQYQSLSTLECDTSAKQPKIYTGDKMIGIGTLHKSNAVPIFRKEDALDQANMRR